VAHQKPNMALLACYGCLVCYTNPGIQGFWVPLACFFDDQTTNIALLA
jgi:hypothetical protein